MSKQEDRAARSAARKDAVKARKLARIEFTAAKNRLAHATVQHERALAARKRLDARTAAKADAQADAQAALNSAEQALAKARAACEAD
jgi:hypothetical protein